MFGKHGVNGGSKKKKKIKLGDYYLPGKERIYAHRRPRFIPKPSLKILPGPWHSESADTDLP